jgi:hypothetical protein
MNSYSAKRIIFNPLMPVFGTRSDDNRGNFGYPSIVKVGTSKQDYIVMMHDFDNTSPYPSNADSVYVDILSMRLYPNPTVVAQAGAQSIANAAFVPLQYSSVNLDTWGMLTGANTDITIREDGVYQINASCVFAASSAGTFRELSIRTYNPPTNTTTQLVTQRLPPSTVAQMNTLRINYAQYFKKGTIVRVGAAHDAGSALSLTNTVYDNGVSVYKIY